MSNRDEEKWRDSEWMLEGELTVAPGGLLVGDGRGESQVNDGFCDCGMNQGGDSAPIP